MSTQLTIINHISELRSRLLKSFVALILASVACFFYSREIFSVLQKPMMSSLPEGSHFIATSAFESYVTYFKVALLSGFFLSAPYIFYQFWRFVAPGLKTGEKNLAFPFSVASGLLFTGGALFGYFVIFPPGFDAMNSILQGTGIQFLPSMSDYFKTMTSLLLMFGVTFELPLLVFILGKMGLITYKEIKTFRRYVIVGLFALSAILTPDTTGIFQVLLSLPLWVLYELGGLSLLLIKKKN